VGVSNVGWSLLTPNPHTLTLSPQGEGTLSRNRFTHPPYADPSRIATGCCKDAA